MVIFHSYVNVFQRVFSWGVPGGVAQPRGRTFVGTHRAEGEILAMQFEVGIFHQWEIQDPKMEVLYHISGHILWGYSLTEA